MGIWKKSAGIVKNSFKIRLVSRVVGKKNVEIGKNRVGIGELVEATYLDHYTV